MPAEFRHADYGALAELWASFYPPRYRVTPEILEQHLPQCPVFDWGASLIQTDDDDLPKAFVAFKRSAVPELYGHGTRDVAHLSAIAFRDPFTAVELFAASKRILRDRGIESVVFGQDDQHFFPGCPEDVPALREFLTIEGFTEVGREVDLEYDLGDYAMPDGVSAPLDRGEGVVRPLTANEVSDLDAFLQREFPGRWHHDVLQQVRVENRPECVFGLFIDGVVHGFAFTQDWNSRTKIGGAVWHLDLGENWGSLGPIGVSASLRGRGFGDALLGSALLQLRERGVRRCIIDWTTLERYYGKHGFVPTRIYRPMRLSLKL